MATSTQKNIFLFVLLSIVLLTLASVLFAWYKTSQPTMVPQDNTQTQTAQQKPQVVTDAQPAQSNEYRSPKGILIYVDSPKKNSTITSPVDISGKTPGSWSFEATFPIDVLDASRRVVGQGYATLEGEWMTEEQVPFSASVSFDQPGTQTGFLVLKNANASGLPEHEDSVEIPIRF